MEIKYNLQGYLVYITLAAYALAFLATVARQKNLGRVLYVAGFLVAVVAFGYRWQHVKHIPLQNMFEVFLCLGMILPPISLFCRRVLQVGAEGADMLIGFIILFPAGFVFNSEPQHLPPALQSWLFAPHVAVYMLSYILMAKAAVPAVAHLIKTEITSEKISPPFYVGSIFLAGIAPIILLFLESGLIAYSLPPIYAFFMYIFTPLFVIYGLILIMILWYKAWHAIQDDQVRTTPGRAVGFTFIPVFNIYWTFQLIWGFAKDCNSFVRRRKVKAKELPENDFLTYATLSLLFCILLLLQVILYFRDITIFEVLDTILIYGIIMLLISLLVVHRICESVRAIHPKRIPWQTNPGLVEYEKATYRMICFGFPFLTLGLILGSYWGKYAWGDFWGWDPKELWSLISWLVYLGYFHFRYTFGKKHAWMNSTIALLGLLAIIITLLWVNLSRLFPGLHNYAT